MKKYVPVALFAYCALVVQSVFASAWFQNKLVAQASPEVSVTIMRWGAPDKVDPQDKKDRIVGQVASDKFKNVTLVLEGVSADKQTHRLSITTDVHVFDNGRYSFCTICGNTRRDGFGSGTKAKGAHTSRGCFFEVFPATIPGLMSLRLVDVKAGGESVHYAVKFNVSPALMRTSFKIPMPQGATVHPATVVVESPAADAATEKAAPAAPVNPAGQQPIRVPPANLQPIRTPRPMQNATPRQPARR